MGRWRIFPQGTRVGRLVTLQDRGVGDREIRCRCDCGTVLSVVATRLTNNRPLRSCGCIKLAQTIAMKARHGMAGTKIYNIWSDMVARCRRVTHPRYADYGGRGITVCDRWLDFVNFYADMGERPEGRSLDRANNDLGYSPENCRWATGVEQRANRRPMKRRPTCGQGHRYGPNPPTNSKGARRCLQCERNHAALQREKRRAAA